MYIYILLYLSLITLYPMFIASGNQTWQWKITPSSSMIFPDRNL